MRKIDPSTLKGLISNQTNGIILDVLPGDHFNQRHIPGALNACIFEIEFIEKVEALIPAKSQEIIVYGQSDAFEAAPLAIEKLQANGWKNVAMLEGGLERWIDQGYPIEGDGTRRAPISGRFDASAEKSVVRWVGRNLLNQHNGIIELQKAIIELDHDQLVGGEAVLDMTSIVCEDIKDPSMAQMLIGHLRTEDFFLVDEFPTAHFQLSSSTAIPNARPGSPNYKVEGLFTLRGHTEKISFLATLGITDEVIALQANFDFDRVLWNSKYGSGKIYEALGKHVVNDLISISFQLVAPIH